MIVYLWSLDNNLKSSTGLMITFTILFYPYPMQFGRKKR